MGASQIKWHEIVQDYTWRQTTFLSDRLPALSGIAAIVAHHNGDEYFAGLWKSTLMNDLAWYMAGSGGGDVCPGAPSWSWASCSGFVRFQTPLTLRYRHTRRPQDAYLVDSDCVPATIDPYGIVQPGASITLSAQTLDATLNTDSMTLYVGRLIFDTSYYQHKLRVDKHFLARESALKRSMPVRLVLLESEYTHDADVIPVLILSRVDGYIRMGVWERIGLAALVNWGEAGKRWSKLGERRNVTIV
jgi:hypothetical protein